MANLMEIGKNPNYLGSYDLYDLNSTEITVTIKSFTEDDVVTNGKTEKCAVMHFQENYKPMIVNPTNKKILAKLFHTKLTEKMQGKKITIHTEKVKAFGQIHDALRIKKVLPKQNQAEEIKIKCEDCNEFISSFGGMNAEQMASYTKSKYGKSLCANCAKKIASEHKEGEVGVSVDS